MGRVGQEWHGCGRAGNVGAYAVRMAKGVAREVLATAFPDDVEYVHSLGANAVITVATTQFESAAADTALVIDTVGGVTQRRSFPVLSHDGVLASSVAAPDQDVATRHGVRAIFFLVSGTSERLSHIDQMIDDGQLTTSVGEVMPLSEAGIAHEMLAGRAHKRGKIVLSADGDDLNRPYRGPSDTVLTQFPRSLAPTLT